MSLCLSSGGKLPMDLSPSISRISNRTPILLSKVKYLKYIQLKEKKLVLVSRKYNGKFNYGTVSSLASRAVCVSKWAVFSSNIRNVWSFPRAKFACLAMSSVNAWLALTSANCFLRSIICCCICCWCDGMAGLVCSKVLTRSLSSFKASLCLVITCSCRSPLHWAPIAVSSVAILP